MSHPLPQVSVLSPQTRSSGAKAVTAQPHTICLPDLSEPWPSRGGRASCVYAPSSPQDTAARVDSVHLPHPTPSPWYQQALSWALLPGTWWVLWGAAPWQVVAVEEI